MMKGDNLVICIGLVFFLGLFITAMVPDDLWEQDVVNTTQAIGRSVTPRATVVFDRGQQRMQQFGGNGQRPLPPVQAQNIAVKGLIPFEAAVTEPFRGGVRQVVTRGEGQSWGQVHVWVEDVSGRLRQISVGPGWYLEYIGCAIEKNQRVRGVAFKFDKRVESQVLYAKYIIVKGARCRLRNDEGFALWSNQLQ